MNQDNSPNINQQLSELIVATQQIATGLIELKEIALQQATTASAQQQTIQQLTAVMAEQARALNRAIPQVVEASRRAAQSAETATLLAQNNQNAIRDLIEEMREARS